MNKKLKTLFIVAMLMALMAMTVASFETNNNEINEEPNSVRGTSRFLLQRSSKATVTCDKNPKVCDSTNCCNNKCVELSTDELNCGRCGKKCGHSKMCCEGKCVIPMTNEKHCGKCGNKCDSKSSCVYGMCSYA
ncbi:stigma-specific STIG1-like protein 1 [Arachis stenosperma]|uniref:stigma-specific STIG1-like protein 1 n=1 Tax=Arachis stenosperma TaxID=217475 RepID=UPI0025ACC13B|nr:stigma-specific STIG1-like protein 1 [Arachis stenosperma]